jgi:uncharacterized protein (TIGR02145 family)
MKQKNFFYLGIAACALLAACEDETPPLLIVSPEHRTAPNDTCEVDFSVSLNNNLPWAVTVDAAAESWCTAARGSNVSSPFYEIGGSRGNGSFGTDNNFHEPTYFVATLVANPFPWERTATFTVQGGGLTQQVTVTQEACDSSLSISPTFFYPESGASDLTLNIKSTMDWTSEVEYVEIKDWLIQMKNWCSLEPSSGDWKDSTITIHLQANPSESRRAAIITIKAGDFVQKDTIIQHGRFISEEGNLGAPKSVVINGIRWAPSNVGSFGAFANLPSTPGKYYQFNKKIGYTYSGGQTEDDEIVGATIAPPFDTALSIYTWEWHNWLLINDPCPEGWRVPTDTELESLRTSGYRWDRNGAWFGPNAQAATFDAPGNAVFLPAAGRIYSNIVYGAGQNGSYWTQTTGQYLRGTCGQTLVFEPGRTFAVPNHFYEKNVALQIRCVREEE